MSRTSLNSFDIDAVFAEASIDWEDLISLHNDNDVPAEIIVEEAESVQQPNQEPDIGEDESDLGSEITNTSLRTGKLLVTVFFDDDELLRPRLSPEYYSIDRDHLRQWVAQFEYTQDGRLHAHIYLEFLNNKRPRFNPLRLKFQSKVPRANLKTVKSGKASVTNTINYCLKNAGQPTHRVPGTDPYIVGPPVDFNLELWNKRIASKSKKSKKQQKDDDFEEARLMVEACPFSWSFDKILHQDDEHKKKLAPHIGKLRGYHNGRGAGCERRKLTRVIVMYGGSGTGKTTMAIAFGSDKYTVAADRSWLIDPNNKFLGGGGVTAYKGQPILRYDEFNGQQEINIFKTICNPGFEGINIDVKNGGTFFNAETVIITTNHHPCDWWYKFCDNDPKQFKAIWRRITDLWFFPSQRPDGTPNVPSDEQEPYFEDQTAEWKTFADGVTDEGIWHNALSHAERNWPLKSREVTTECPWEPNDRKRSAPEDAFHQYCRTGKYPKVN